MKNVLLLIHDDPGQDARLQAALDLTRALSGHLTCLDVTVPPVVMGGEFVSAAGQAVLIDVARDLEAKNKVAIETRLQKEDVPWDWIDATNSVPAAVEGAAGLSDIIVLNRKLDSVSLPDMASIASRIVTHVRKPVLTVPETTDQLDLSRPIIAWDGHASCTAAMQACLPLLILAQEVEIFTVRDGSETTDPQEAAEYLSRHGVHAAVRILDDGLTRVDDLIEDEATRFDASYVVMGAYGRGRLMETFGGVTKRMLAHSRLPLVLGH